MTQFRLSACSILLRPSTQSITGVEFYLVRRAPTLEFMGGFQVFPGGKVDPGDHEVPVEGLEDHQAIYCCAARGARGSRCSLLWPNKPRGDPKHARKASQQHRKLGRYTRLRRTEPACGRFHQPRPMGDTSLHPRPARRPTSPVGPRSKTTIIVGELTDGVWLTPEQAGQSPRGRRPDHVPGARNPARDGGTKRVVRMSRASWASEKKGATAGQERS